MDENLEYLREEFLKNGGHEITDAITVIKFMLSKGFSRRPEPLVRGMEIDIEAFAKDMFEVCHYPAPEYWKDQDENTKSRWRTNAEIIRDKAHVWLKEVGGE